MTDQEPNFNQQPAQPSNEDSWGEVGRQFQALGEGIADAFRTAWKDPENRRRMGEVKLGVEAMVNQVSSAMDDAANSPEGQRAQVEAKKAAASFQRAFDETSAEVRPQVLSALQNLNTELRKFIDQLKNEGS